jgi:hypothetical protein
MSTEKPCQSQSKRTNNIDANWQKLVKIQTKLTRILNQKKKQDFEKHWLIEPFESGRGLDG